MNENLNKKIRFAISLIQSASKMAEKVGQPLEICYSGGKDSDVILELTKMAGVKYRAIYKNTTIDPPHTIAHAKEKGAEIMPPKMTFREVVHDTGLPGRYRRICCGKLKEYKILDYTIVGIRKAESVKRGERYKEPEICRVYNKKEKVRQYLPILDWTDEDVKNFIAEIGIKCHPLYYDEGGVFHVERRLGCIGCPLKSKNKRMEDFLQYPKMVRFYVKAAQRYLDTHPQSKINRYFKDACEWFAFTLYCENLDEFKYKFGANLFGNGIDCKEHLEKLFNIKI